MRVLPVIMLALALVGALGRGITRFCNSARIPGDDARELSLYEFCSEAGVRADCYFILEAAHQDTTVSIFPGQRELRKRKHWPTSAAEAVVCLNAALKGFRASVWDHCPGIVRVQQVDLEKNTTYTINQNARIEHSGGLPDLVLGLGKGFEGRLRPGSYAWSKMDDFSGWWLQLKVSAKDSKVRQILTDWIPLSDYNRVLWEAESHPWEKDPRKLSTEVRYLGPVTHDDLSQRAYECVSFELGEKAYRNNPDRFGPNPEDNTAQLAIKFIEDRMSAKNPLQVRWAMFFLGKVKAEEGIPVLLEYLDYQYTTHGIVEESYPALKALRQIGKLAATAAIAELAKEQSELRTELLCRVVLAVHGQEKGKATLEEVVRQAKDEPRKKRLQTSLTKTTAAE